LFYLSIVHENPPIVNRKKRDFSKKTVSEERFFEFTKSSILFPKNLLTHGSVCGIIAKHGKVGYDPGGC